MLPSFCLARRIWGVSYAKSQVNDVIRYIKNQETHHQKENFLNEYRKYLNAFEVEWDERYIFKEPE